MYINLHAVIGLRMMENEFVKGTDHYSVNHLCSSCGLCVGFCGQISSYHDRVAIVGGCRRQGGYCSTICPWFLANDHEVYYCQDVSTYVFCSIVENEFNHDRTFEELINALFSEVGPVITVDTSGGTENAKPISLNSINDVNKINLSTPYQVPSLSILNNELRNAEDSKVNVVCRPCQANAVMRLKAQSGYLVKNIGVVITVDCQGMLDRQKWLNWLTKQGAVRPIVNSTFSDQGWIFKDSNEKTFVMPIYEADMILHHTCTTCAGFEHHLPDITVISNIDNIALLCIATIEGRDIFQTAIKRGLLREHSSRK